MMNLAQGDQGFQQFLDLSRLDAGETAGELFGGERTGRRDQRAAQRLDLFGERFGPGEFLLRRGGDRGFRAGRRGVTLPCARRRRHFPHCPRWRDRDGRAPAARTTR
jgi:hypothetical protein